VWTTGYYTSQARAYSGLGMTKEAIDAAAAGVIAWALAMTNDQRRCTGWVT
jgi:hypothetical protein